MKIWVDLANAPHVGFFLPIIGVLRESGHEVFITMRDFNQTVELARKNGLEGEVIGIHGGASSIGKLLNLLKRSIQLTRYGNRQKIDIAVSHNSYTHTIAGRLIGAKVVTIMDYEGQPANHIAFRVAHRVIVPSVFPEAALKRFGCRREKVFRYEGFKEQVYLSGFKPDMDFPRDLIHTCGLNDHWSLRSNVLVTVRTPASMAAYHPFKNELFEKLLSTLDKRQDLTVVLLPRTPDQRAYYGKKYPRLHIPSAALSGNDLMYFSDVVVSAGGTMNREAAVLGTPVFTIFAGQLPAVDLRLISMGRLFSIETEDDFKELRFQKKTTGNVLMNPDLCRLISDQIVSW